MTRQQYPPGIITHDGTFIMSPKNDFVFRLLFGDEKNKDITIAFLMAILRIPILDISIKDPHLLKQVCSDKAGTLDIRIVTDTDTQIDVEIQLTDHPAIRERILFYWSKLYISQISTGNHYHVLKKTISIIFLDYVFLPVESVHTCFRLYDKDHDVVLTDTMEVHIFELPKLDISKKQNKQDLEIPWLQFLHAETEEELLMAAEAEPKIAKAYSNLLEMSEDDEIRRLYDERLAYIVDVELRMQASEERGMEIGKQEGIKEGVKEGKQEGIVEERHRLAQKMITEGMDDKVIVKLTGLDTETIRQLRSETPR